MTEIEQLRKELNELRERVAILEAQPHNKWVPTPAPNPYQPPYIVTCGVGKYLPDDQMPYRPDQPRNTTLI